MIFRNIRKNLPLVALILAVGFSPSFIAGKISGRNAEIRIEDFLVIAVGLFYIFRFLISGKEKIERPPFFF